MIYDPYLRRRAAPNYDKYNSEGSPDPVPASTPRLPLTANDIPDDFPVEAGSAAGPDAETQVATTKARLQSLVDDPDYWRHRKPDAVTRVTKAFEAAYRGGGGVDATGKLIRTDPNPIDFAELNLPTQRDPSAPAAKARGDAATAQAVWPGGSPPARDLRYEPDRDRTKISPAQDAYDQKRFDRAPWMSLQPPLPAGPLPRSTPTHRDAEHKSENTLRAYERNLGRDHARYPVIDLPEEGQDRRINAPLLYNESRDKERTRSILDDTPGRIVVHENADDDGKPHSWEFHSDGRMTVARYDSIVRREAVRYNVDPDLVRAIMYVENARGRFYGRPAERIGLGIAKSILPMNIRYDVWGPLGFSKEDFFNPELNIRAGVMLIRRIQDRLENPTVAKIAQLYNNLSTDKVLVEGARAAHAYRTRAWERP